MRITIPLTGTLLAYEPIPVGDDSDPVRPIPLDLGNVSWQLIYLDLENDEAVIEVAPAEMYDEPTGEFDSDGNPVCLRKQVTNEMKEAALKKVKDLLLDHGKDELYRITNSRPLRKPQRGKSGETVNEVEF